MVTLLEPPGSNRFSNEESQAKLLNFSHILSDEDDECFEKSTCNLTDDHPINTNLFERWFMRNSNLSEFSDEWRKDFSKHPTWVDADMSLRQILRGNADGNKAPLYSRVIIQLCLNKAGNFVQKHALAVICLICAVFAICCFGLRHVRVETDIVKLWVSEDGRLNDELQYFSTIQQSFSNETENYDEHLFLRRNNDPKLFQIPDDEIASSGYQVLIHTTSSLTGHTNLLTKEGLLQHMDLMYQIKHMKVEKFGLNWTLEDICFKPGGLDIESDSIAFGLKPTLERLIPCIWITPIDCFFEGAKPIGPSPPIDTSEIMGGFIRVAFSDIPKHATWANINPKKIVNQIYNNFDLGTMLNFFLRTGINEGYLSRPCIDPLDPQCPKEAPNYYISACESLQFFKNNVLQPKGTELENELSPFFHLNDVEQDNISSFADIFGPLLFGVNTNSKNKTQHEIDCERYRPSFLRWMNDNLEKSKSLFSPEFLPVYPDYGKVMADGCNGFASAVMNWPIDMILGGVKESGNGSIEAEAFQSIILVASPTEVYLRLNESRTLNNLKIGLTRSEYNFTGAGANLWSPLLAKEVIMEWQRKFTSFIYNHPLNIDSNGYSHNRVLHPLATVSISDMLGEYCDFNFGVIFAGYFLMLIYTVFSQIQFDNCCLSVNSSAGLAFSGVIIVTFASISGLGFATWLGIEFNAATTQVVPFLTLGIGVDNMFLLLHNYPHVTSKVKKDEIGILMKSTGMSILMTSINNILSFLAGTILPIPALRSFCTQCSILLTFNLLAILTIFPAVISLDLSRKKKGLRDFFCCLLSQEHKQNTTHESSYGFTRISDTILSPHDFLNQKHLNYYGLVTVSKGKDDDDEELCDVQPFSLRNFLRNYYIPLISHEMTKFFVLFFCVLMFGVALFEIRNSEIGLELSDILPDNTPPAAFLKARDKYFSFYPMHIVLRGKNINFPEQQHLIDNLRQDIGRSQFIVKQRNGEPSERYWLQLFRDWLKGLQIQLDEAEAKGILTDYDRNNFTKKPDLDIAYSLVCSYGNHYNCSRARRVKLIDETGTINFEGFYNYLYAWHEYEAMFYSVSQALFHPKLNKLRQGIDKKRRFRYFVPPAPKPLFSRIPFYLTGLKNTSVIVEMIKEIRTISENYSNLGLDNYPEGVAFTFWEQYLDLNTNLLKAIGVISFAVFCVITLLLFNPWAACCVLSVLLIIAVELTGFLGFCQIKLNPVSAVTLITAIGIGVEFTVHVVFAFLTALGTRNKRMSAAVDQVFVPVIHGALSTLLGILMLGFSKFDFVFKYFFVVLTALIIIGLINGLILLPVLLSLIGPKCEIQPKDGSDQLIVQSYTIKRSKKFRENFILDDTSS